MPYLIKSSVLRLSNASRSRRLAVFQRFKLVFVESGRARWQIGRSVIEIGPGDVVLLNNQEPRVFQEILAPGELCCFILECEPQFLFATPFHALFLGAWHERAQHFHGDPPVLQLLGQMRREYDGHAPFSDPILCAGFFHLLALLARGCGLPEQDGPPPGSGLMEAMRYIDAHLTEPLSVAQLAGVAHQSESAFTKRFAAYNGISPMQYVLRKRIDYAAHLLEREEGTVLDIALCCGFQNSANFYRAFRKFTGCSPSQYRRSAAKGMPVPRTEGWAR